MSFLRHSIDRQGVNCLCQNADSSTSVFLPKILPYPKFSSAKRLAAREHFSVQLYIIKLMLNEWLRGGVISSRSYPRYIIPAVNSGRLFIQKARRATVGSRFLAETRDRPSSSLSLTLFFGFLATLDHAKFSYSCHHDPA